MEGTPDSQDLKGIPDAEAGADAAKQLEQNRKLNTSGLSWDEVTDEEKKTWHQITEMGEGD